MQRGHNRERVFVDDRDREAYLVMLREAAQQYGVAIHGYVLLDAEVHLLATPEGAGSLSRLLQSLGRRYVAAFNRRHERSGTLWEGRFRTGLIEGASLGAQALVHIEALPIRAGLVGTASEWPWSSAAHHMGRRRDPLVTEHPAYWSLGNTPFERELAHADLLRDGLPDGLAERFERAVFQGRVIGSAAFCEQVEARVGLPIAPKARGRPARNTASV
jgi:putative transposase